MRSATMNSENMSIEDTVVMDVNYPSVSDRYFNHYYFIPKYLKDNTAIPSVHSKQIEGNETTVKETIDKNKDKSSNKSEGEDTCIMMHSNRICVMCISHKHPIIVDNKTVEKVVFDVDGIDRLSNKVSGRGKRGAQIMGQFSILCRIVCSDGSTYTVYSGVRGKLIEVNDQLLQSPHLISLAPKSDGYLAVVLPSLHESNKLKNNLWSSAEYEKFFDKTDGS